MKTRSLAEWNQLGRRVKAESRPIAFTPEGVPLFTKEQTKKQEDRKLISCPHCDDISERESFD